MSHQTSAGVSAAQTTSLTARLLPILSAALLGVIIIAGVGFTQLSAVHNAAHDYRHSMGFPCH
jgi:cobalt transporter subunit CbtB